MEGITSRIKERETYYFVGRQKELLQFSQFIEDRGHERPSIFHIYGTGGIGKTTFLHICKTAVEDLGYLFLQLDSSDFIHTAEGLVKAIYRQLELIHPPYAKACQQKSSSLSDLIELLLQISASTTLVIAFDTFEEMPEIEPWLRDLLPLIMEEVFIVFAGRYPLKGPWISSPAWREHILQIPLNYLNQNETSQYLQKCDIYDENETQRIWERTHGHPLSLSLYTASRCNSGELISEHKHWFEDVAETWLREVPDSVLRRYLDAASLFHVFDQDALSFILNEEIPTNQFDQLIHLSFVRRTERGWQLHELMRVFTHQRFRFRSPVSCRKLTDRCALYYAERILTSSDRISMDWEVGEFFRYMDVDVIRALTGERKNGYYWEVVTESTLPEAKSYVEWRRATSQTRSRVEIDPVTGKEFCIEYSSEEIRFNIHHLDIYEVFHLDPRSLLLLRNDQGEVAALSVIIPIHKGTLPWLERDPVTSPFILSCSLDERKALAVHEDSPCGWFIRTADFIDLLNPEIRIEGIYLFYAYMCRGGLLLASPFPSPITHHAYTGFGFEVAQGASHTHYDSVTTTPTFVLDTRGEKLRSFIEQILIKSRIIPDGSSNRSPFSKTLHTETISWKSHLTNREQEVAHLVMKGLSNKDIAKQLYISEVTVKKHLNAIFQKLGISRRTQLVHKITSLE